MPILGILASAQTGNLATLAYDSIATQTVGAGGAASVTFSSIPGTYKHLQIRAFIKATDDWLFSANGSGGTSYDRHLLYGQGSAVSANTYLNTPSFYAGYGGNPTQWGSYIVDILDYANTNKYKTTRSLAGWDGNGSGFIMLNSSLWRNTSAITSINITAQGTIQQYSHFGLYGIKG